MSLVESWQREEYPSQFTFRWAVPRFRKKDVDEWFTYEKLKRFTGIIIDVESVDIDTLSYFVDYFSQFEDVIPIVYFNFTVTRDFISYADLGNIARFITLLPSLSHLTLEFGMAIYRSLCLSAFLLANAIANAHALKFLHFTALSMTPEVLENIITGVSRNETITHLFVNSSQIRQDKLYNELLLKSKTITSFGLSCSRINFRELIPGISSCKTLQKLLLRNVGSNEIPIQEIVTLFQAVSQNGNIDTLDLTHTIINLSNEEASLIPEMIQNTPNLEALVLKDCKLTSRDETVIQKIIQTSMLSHLDLRCNYLNDGDLLNIIITVCKNSYLRELFTDEWGRDDSMLLSLPLVHIIKDNTSLFTIGIGDDIYGHPLSGTTIFSENESLLLSYLERNRQNDKMKKMTLMVLFLSFLPSSSDTDYSLQDENNDDNDEKERDSKRLRIR